MNSPFDSLNLCSSALRRLKRLEISIFIDKTLGYFSRNVICQGQVVSPRRRGLVLHSAGTGEMLESTVVTTWL